MDTQAHELAKLGTDVVSGVATDARLESDPPAFEVSWIEWNSDFRRELRLNDRIIAVNGESLSPILRPQQIYQGIGQYGEGGYWSRIGAKAGDEIVLSVLRDGEPMLARGRLGTNMFYYDRDGKTALAPGGPARLAHDIVSSAWSSWHEGLVKRMSHMLTRAWIDKIPTRRELADILAHQPRITFLLEKYPGLFAQTMHDDWTRTVELLSGKRADPPVNLEYRALGEQRAALARKEGQRAWQAILAETAAERIPASPAVSPMKREQAVGKIVELPAITNSQIINDLGKTIGVIGSAQDSCYWFLMFDRPEMLAFYEVLYRYQGQVNPRIREQYRYLARVLDDSWMLTVWGRPAMGLALQPLAALAGDDELFVDLRTSKPQFAGEAELSIFEAVTYEDSSPISVLEAMIQAVKTGNEAMWRSLFASWRTVAGGGSRTIIDFTYATNTGMFASSWELSRRSIMGEVLDARVSHVEKVRRILSRSDGNGLPDVDQVVVWVDHYGLFEGEHRTFQQAGVNRRWVLQRLDGGPWKIVTIQSL